MRAELIVNFNLACGHALCANVASIFGQIDTDEKNINHPYVDNDTCEL